MKEPMRMRRLLSWGGLTLLALLAACLPAAADGGRACAPCGYGGGGRFTALAVDPRNPQVVLAGSDVAGVFKSTDGGDSFAPKGRGLESFAAAAIAFHPQRPGEVYLLTDGGLYASSDSAESWRLISRGVRYARRFFGSRLLVFFDRALWAGTDGGGVFRISVDTPAAVPAAATGLAGITVTCLAVHRGMLYAATAQGMYRLEAGRWNPVGRGLPEGAADMTDMAAHASGRLYAVEKKTGLYLLDDTAEAWVPAGHGRAAGLAGWPASFKALGLDPAARDRIFLASHPEAWPYLLLESRSGGRSWEKAGRFIMADGSPLSWRDPPDAVEVIYACPGVPGRMFLADWWNLWRSTDGGRSWRQLARGLQNAVVNDVKQHPREPDTLFMAVADNGLVKSVDGGRTWARCMAGVENGHGIEIELSPPDGQTMYFLLQPWVRQDRVLVYTSTDGGDTWRDVGFSVAGLTRPELPFVDGTATNLELDPHRDGVVYVGTNGYGIFKTDSGGREWAPVNNGLAAPFIKGPDALLAHPHLPDTLFAATQGGGIHMTTDGGGSWRRVSPDGLFTFGMAADPFSPLGFAAGCAEKMLLVSVDGGRSWAARKLPGDRPEHISAYAVAYDPAVPGRLYAGTLAYGFRAADGLFASADGGETFSGIDLDMPMVSMNDLAIMRGARPRLLLGLNGVGLYCAELRP